MTHPYRRIGALLAALLVLLLANLSWLQVLDAETLRKRNDNARALLEDFNRARGPIIVGSEPIAMSSRARAGGFYQRTYTNGPLYAAVTGYSSLLYGSIGIERSQNMLLSGTDPRLFVDRVQQLFAGQRQAGGAVTITIDAAAQQAAFDALKGQRGAAVAIDARTGALLTVVSLPSYDPAQLAPNNPARVRAAYESLVLNPGQPLLNRALGKTYPVGSVFELLVAGTALASGHRTTTSTIPAGTEFDAGGTVIRNPAGVSCGSTVTIDRALRARCATAFAWLGRELGAEVLRSAAEQYGFNASPNAQLPAVASIYPRVPASVALTATGEGGVEATVLQLAMVSATLANHGTLMDPYIVRDVRAQNLAVLDEARPEIRSTPLAQRTADALSALIAGIGGDRTCGSCMIGRELVHSITGGPTAGPSWALAYAGNIAVATLVESPDNEGVALHAALSTLRAALGVQ